MLAVTRLDVDLLVRTGFTAYFVTDAKDVRALADPGTALRALHPETCAWA